MKMQYFQEVGGGGVRRVRPMLDPPLGMTPLVQERIPERRIHPNTKSNQGLNW